MGLTDGFPASEAADALAGGALATAAGIRATMLVGAAPVTRWLASIVGERCFGKLKQFRAMATSYDKRQRAYHGTVDIASVRI
jgi:hypothetical protein